VPPISATGAHRPRLLPGSCGDVAVDGDGEPEELADPAPDWVWLGDAELEAELADGELADGELADDELAVGDTEVAGDVTVNCSTAMTALTGALTRAFTRVAG
jgi:hypothetical protein